LKMAWSKRFIPKLFVWHSSRDIVRMKWRYYRTGLYTEKKRSHWLTVPTFRRSPNYIFNQWQLAFSYLLNPFLSLLFCI